MVQSILKMLLTLVVCTDGFQVLAPSAAANSKFHPRTPLPATRLWMSNDGELAAKRMRKRVKRKEPMEGTSEVVKENVKLQPRNDAPVELKIQDVRQVVGGSMTESQQQEQQTSSPQRSSNIDLREDSESGGSGDSLEQLLADAKAMRKDDGLSLDNKKEGDVSIQETVRNALSTIVTIDFFVVCALLLWFLAGIFGSYVLKNDAVQIAFNSIFQQVVQPALGILMIGSAASGMYTIGIGK
jgi:hypothetical protein